MPKHKYPVSDHYDGNIFFNPGLKIKKSLRNVMKMLKEKRSKNKWPKWRENTAKPILATELTDDQVYITYVNHASHLIQLQNLNIITDPIFSKRAGPLSLVGPKRVRSPGIKLKKLPHIHVILVSHNHYDHMDLGSLKKLEKLFHPLIIVPLGNKKYLAEKKFHNVVELDWWQTHQINSSQSVTLVPAQHWSMRRFNDANKALWGGFWIHSNILKIFFAGDTGYGPHFKLIQQKLGSPNISILPIGAYQPRWFMKEQHMNPEEAVLASIDLQSDLSIATHHQTFHLALDHIDDPVIDLKHSMQTHGLTQNDFIAPETGETIIYSRKNK